MKLTQFLVAAGLICMFMCLCHASYADQSAWAEKQLLGWQPGPEHSQLPIRSIRHRKMEIAGEWDRRGGHDGSHLSIEPSGKHTYAVAFRTAGCFGDWHLERSAKYINGVLTLDRPVEEQNGFTYKRLYAVRIAGEEYLLPSVAVARVHGAILADGSLALGQEVVPRFLFARRTTKKRRMLPTLPPHTGVLILATVCAGAGMAVSIALLERRTRT